MPVDPRMPPDPSPDPGYLRHQTLFTQTELAALRGVEDQGAAAVVSLLILSERLQHGLDVPVGRDGDTITNAAIAAQVVRELARHPDVVEDSRSVNFAGPDATVNAFMNDVLHAPGIAAEVVRQRVIRKALDGVVSSLSAKPGMGNDMAFLDDVPAAFARMLEASTETSRRFAGLELGPSLARAAAEQKQAGTSRRTRHAAVPQRAATGPQTIGSEPAGPRATPAPGDGRITSPVAQKVWDEMEALREKQERRTRFGGELSDFEVQRPLRALAREVADVALARQPDGRLLFEGGTAQDRAVINSVLAFPGFQEEVTRLRGGVASVFADYPAITPATGAATLPQGAENLFASMGIESVQVSLHKGL